VIDIILPHLLCNKLEVLANFNPPDSNSLTRSRQRPEPACRDPAFFSPWQLFGILAEPPIGTGQVTRFYYFDQLSRIKVNAARIYI
jgi:hypothetical protein